MSSIFTGDKMGAQSEALRQTRSTAGKIAPTHPKNSPAAIGGDDIKHLCGRCIEYTFINKADLDCDKGEADPDPCSNYE
ncbi:hypothetical protein AJ80_06063 [Polytolypa hystricis UAMH7299]|uniref:Uncharacterized protein n=1 Tax=Polytolypa hystricis (strain UAMH7299) TaxID=1447883 RepID=A0A2B7XYR3_POLH7|nr:hypothetical protein AJ80_06063 [Polytolypa hystricis UAMH7299]